jgi:hypothetical protein
MRRAALLLGHLVAMIGLVWLIPIAILLIGIPIAVIVRVIAAAVGLGAR